MTFASLSGGRDSTAMIVRWCELDKPLDYILFANTKYEFKEMYAYIDKLEGYLKAKFGKTLTRLESTQDMFSHFAFEKPIERGEHKGRLRGLPKTLFMDYCTRELKAKPMKAFVKDKSPQRFNNEILIGYTFDEVENGRRSSLDYGIARYPLHEWGWNESEVEDFLKARGIANPLYKHFSRTGCFLCPKQSVKALYELFKHYPQKWQVMLEMEERAKKLNCLNQTFKPAKSLKEYEKEFKARLDLDLNDEYQENETCFCR